MPKRQLASSQVKTEFISLPEYFFIRIMPKIYDLAELKIVLYVTYLILRKQEHPHPDIIGVTYEELKSAICRLPAELDEETLRQALDLAIEHGTLLHSTSNINEVLEDIYSLPALMYRRPQPPTVNIFALYEQNIGMITPMIVEELKEAEKLYPPQWIEEAFKEAVTLNKRSWKYIARILDRWASEGKDSGEYRRDIKKNSSDKYVKGKYGHLVQR